MKAITVRRAGLAEADAGKTGEGEAAPRLDPRLIRIRVKYAGVGFADVMAVRGGYPLAPARPFSPGYEFMGHVEEAGGFGFAAGDRVAGMLPRMGAYREQIDVDPRFVVPLPSDLSDERAALLPLNYLTALAMIERCARLEEGRSFLIHGAAGGVGGAALELARLFKLRAFGSASASKRELVASLGATPLCREGDRWVDELARLAPQGVDAAFDAFGIESFRRSWSSLSDGGTLVCYGISPGIDGGNAAFLEGLVYLASRKLFSRRRRVRVCGTPSIVAADPSWYKSALTRILEWARAGSLEPVLAGILPWDRVSEAHAALASGSIKGKLLLDFS